MPQRYASIFSFPLSHWGLSWRTALVGPQDSWSPPIAAAFKARSESCLELIQRECQGSFPLFSLNSPKNPRFRRTHLLRPLAVSYPRQESLTRSGRRVSRSTAIAVGPRLIRFHCRARIVLESKRGLRASGGAAISGCCSPAGHRCWGG